MLTSALWSDLAAAWRNWRVVGAQVRVRSNVLVAPGTAVNIPVAAFAISWDSTGGPSVPTTLPQVMEYANAQTLAISSITGDEKRVSWRANPTLINEAMWNTTTSTLSAYGAPFVVCYANWGTGVIATPQCEVMGWLDMEFRSLATL